MDLVLKRSLNKTSFWRLSYNQAFPGGRRSNKRDLIWPPLQTVIRGEGKQALMIPCPVVDRLDGTIFVFCNRPSEDYPENGHVEFAVTEHSFTVYASHLWQSRLVNQIFPFCACDKSFTISSNFYSLMSYKEHITLKKTRSIAEKQR